MYGNVKKVHVRKGKMGTYRTYYRDFSIFKFVLILSFPNDFQTKILEKLQKFYCHTKSYDLKKKFNLGK